VNQSTDAVTRDLPEALCADVRRHWEAYCAAAAEAGIEPPGNAHFLRYLGRVWAASDFVALSCVREPALIGDLLASGDLLGDYARGEMLEKAQAAVADVADAGALGSALRRLRRRELVRIAWRDLTGWARVEEVLEDLSALADACVQVALERLHAWQCRAYGTPVTTTGTATGRPQGLVVLGMGKLGARELNFSSDIDLIFAYPEAGQGLGRRRGRPGLSDEEFFNRLAQDLIQVLNDPTPEGFVYRVDMRLRPYGDSGPLAMSFAAIEEYYQSQGREWERYAMVKARPIAGDAQDAAELAELLRPFVYRRYLDFGAFEQLREMKALIRKEVERRGLRDDIKLGPGGIREIEFTAQVFQLMRGVVRAPLLRTLERIGVKRERVEALAAWLRRRGWRGVAVSRMTPGVRVGSIAASGLTDLPLGSFVIGLVVGNTAFVSAHFALGVLLGASAGRFVGAAAASLLPVALGVVVLAVVGAVAWRLLGRRRRRAMDASIGAWADAACPACLVPVAWVGLEVGADGRTGSTVR